MSHYCRWCDTLVNVVVKEYDKNGYAIWIGCNGCYKKRQTGLKRNVKVTE